MLLQIDFGPVIEWRNPNQRESTVRMLSIGKMRSPFVFCSWKREFNALAWFPSSTNLSIRGLTKVWKELSYKKYIGLNLEVFKNWHDFNVLFLFTVPFLSVNPAYFSKIISSTTLPSSLFPFFSPIKQLFCVLLLKLCKGQCADPALACSYL